MTSKATLEPFKVRYISIYCKVLEHGKNLLGNYFSRGFQIRDKKDLIGKMKCTHYLFSISAIYVTIIGTPRRGACKDMFDRGSSRWTIVLVI